MGRWFRFLVFLTRGVRPKRPFNKNALRTWWFLSQFSIQAELRYFSNLIVEISTVSRFCGLLPDHTNLLNALIDGNGTDIDTISGVELTVPTQGILLLLYEYNDLPSRVITERWMWAVSRDTSVSKKHRCPSKRIALNQTEMRKRIENFNHCYKLEDTL